MVGVRKMLYPGLALAFAWFPAQAYGAAVIAHRGAGAGPHENTVESVGYAARHSADWVETDVRATADSRFVMLHDAKLDRTTNCTGPVAARKQWFVTHRCRTDGGELVPSLTAYLDAVAAGRLSLLIELKAELTSRQAQRVARKVRDWGIAPRSVLQSSDPALLAAARAAVPELPGMIIASAFDAPAVDTALSGGAIGVLVYWQAVRDDPAAVADLHARRFSVGAWTANQAPTWQVLLDAGVDGIITNRPRALADFLATQPQAARSRTLR